MDRQHRVRERAAFARLRQEGRRLTHPLLRLQWVANPLPVTRFGFVVGNRVAGHAHERNLLRRRLRSLAHAALPHLAAGYDVLVIAQPASRTAAYQELEAALWQLLHRARLAHGEPSQRRAAP